MKVDLQPELAKRKPLAEVVEAATPVLEEVIGGAAERVTATWDFQPDDHGRPLLQLTLADWSGQATASFAPEEFQASEKVRWRFRRLWRDLLNEALDKQIQKLKAYEAQSQDE
jgi:hypothetical protein